MVFALRGKGKERSAKHPPRVERPEFARIEKTVLSLLGHAQRREPAVFPVRPLSLAHTAPPQARSRGGRREASKRRGKGGTNNASPPVSPSLCVLCFCLQRRPPTNTHTHTHVRPPLDEESALDVRACCVARVARLVRPFSAASFPAARGASLSEMCGVGTHLLSVSACGA